ncbi:MAG: RNA polymerase sigma factor [Acidobacteria bacterium]|nr:RNA polymerase sigma factor [Acidobacteriota bacterium]
MKRLVDRVRAAVRRSCPPYLASQAEDIAQEVLIQLVRKLQRDEGKSNFSSMYLLKAAHGVTVDEIRRRSRRREQTGLEDTMQVHIHSAPDPERQAVGRSLGLEIRRCLERMIASRRVAVTLHLLGCAVPEIADRLQCPLKAADNRVYRGMKDLRKCLEAKGMTP